MSSGRTLRCGACTRRIRDHHPHIGLLDVATGTEIASYHARGGCQAYVLRHYHSSACPDERPGFGCSGGCFDTVAVAN